MSFDLEGSSQGKSGRFNKDADPRGTRIRIHDAIVEIVFSSQQSELRQVRFLAGAAEQMRPGNAVDILRDEHHRTVRE